MSDFIADNIRIKQYRDNGTDSVKDSTNSANVLLHNVDICTVTPACFKGKTTSRQSTNSWFPEDYGDGPDKLVNDPATVERAVWLTSMYPGTFLYDKPHSVFYIYDPIKGRINARGVGRDQKQKTHYV